MPSALRELAQDCNRTLKTLPLSFLLAGIAISPARSTARRATVYATPSKRDCHKTVIFLKPGGITREFGRLPSDITASGGKRNPAGRTL
jgi:hypothetical protein